MSQQPPRFSLNSLLQRFRPDLAFFHWARRYLPRGLYGRALLILVVPVLLAQGLATYIFYERHWTTVTNRLAFALAGEIAVLASRMDEGDPQRVVHRMHETIGASMELDISYHADKDISHYPMRGDYSSLLGRMLLKALEEKLGKRPFALDLRHEKEWIAIHVQLHDGVLSVRVPERRVYTPTADIFIIWMLGSSVLLSAIAILFLRNQIRPIRRLADAAEQIGKGLDVPHFRPEGAREVRQAAINLLIMRDRLKRQISQRTAMLNGVSHDLRTPLTRMKLQLALMPESPDRQELLADVEEMKAMIESYLAFARGEDEGDPESIDMEMLLNELCAAARRSGASVQLNITDHAVIRLRAQAIKRALGNLISNAARYGKEVWVSTHGGQKFFDVLVDDNGPGIPESQREDVFRPFMRLESSRNPETGGIGLGLTIARDIARRHGGDILLGQSPQGGLRATLRLPI